MCKSFTLQARGQTLRVEAMSSSFPKSPGGEDVPNCPHWVSWEVQQWYLLRKPVAQLLVLLQAGKSSSPEVFAMISFDDFNLAGWEERRSVCSCPPSYSLIRIIAFSLLERTFTPQTNVVSKALWHKWVCPFSLQEWTALAVLWHRPSPPLSPSLCSAVTVSLPERFSPFFPKCVFLFGYF